MDVFICFEYNDGYQAVTILVVESEFPGPESLLHHWEIFHVTKILVKKLWTGQHLKDPINLGFLGLQNISMPLPDDKTSTAMIKQEFPRSHFSIYFRKFIVKRA